MAQLAIVYAWYGVDAGPNIDRGMNCGRAVAAIVQERFVVGGTLRVPGDLNAHFGDPLPCVLKMLAVHARDPRTGADRHLRFREGSGGEWSFAHGPREFEYGGDLRVLDAWYGTHEQQSRAGTAGRTAAVTAQTFVDGSGTLGLPGALNGLFGDPLPGVPKVCCVRVQDSSGELHELWFPEGRDGAWRTGSVEMAQRHEGNVQGRPLRVLTGWYGAPNGGKVHAVAQRSVAEHVAANFVEDGRLHVPGNMNAHFGDPAPGVVKTLCLTVRDLVSGYDNELTFRENEGGVWPRRESDATHEAQDPKADRAVAAAAEGDGACCAKLRAEVEGQKWAIAVLEKSIRDRDATIAELRSRLGEA